MVPFDILGLAIELLAAVEAARVTSSEDVVEVCNGQIIRVMQIAHKEMASSVGQEEVEEVEIVFRSTSTSAPVSTSSTSFGLHEAKLHMCLKKILNLIKRITNKEEYYFCTYKHEIYMSEVRMVITYLRETLNACEAVPSFDPLLRLHSLTCLPTKSDDEHETNKAEISGNSSPIPAFEDFVLADIVTQLFWLKYFMGAIVVTWENYIASFVIEFGSHHEYSLRTYKTLLCTLCGGVTLTPSGTDTGGDTDAGIDASAAACPTSPPPAPPLQHCVTLENYLSFAKRESRGGSVYDAFQRACDPGSIVLMTGLLVDDQVSSISGSKIYAKSRILYSTFCIDFG